MCDKIDDEYVDFLENYLSDVLTGGCVKNFV